MKTSTCMRRVTGAVMVMVAALWMDAPLPGTNEASAIASSFVFAAEPEPEPGPGQPPVSPLQSRSLQAEQPDAEVDGLAIDKAVEDGMKRYGIPGLAVGIVKDGRTVYLKGYGKADDSGRAVTPETPFLLGSVSKSFTALAVMQLAEKGMLELDEAAEVYLPGVRLAVPEGGRAVTVRDLLQHTSGLSTHDGRSMMAAEGRSPKEAVQRWGRLEAEVRAGEAFQYSNANYILLGAIVEQVSGMPYSKYMENHIFKPLDMTNSFAEPAVAEAQGMADGYQRIFGRMTAAHWSVRPPVVPAGYLAASAEDMTHYLIAQMEGGRYGNAVLLSEEGMAAMHSRSAGFPYGMGWFLAPSAISHGGDTESFHADVLLLPEKGWAIAVLMNTNDVLLTSLYGNMYEALSYRILQAASGGEAFPAGLPETPPFGPAVLGMNALVALLALWAVGAAYRPWKLWRRWRKRGPSGERNAAPAMRAAPVSVLVAAVHIGLPIVFWYGFPYANQAPWAVILRFMPGWGHALLVLPMALLMAGIAEGALAAWKRWRWRR